jgi:hypothetical protein
MSKKQRQGNPKAAAMVALSMLAVTTLFPEKAFAQTVNCNEPMDFGEIFSCAGTGTVTIHPEDGSPTTYGGCISSAGAPTSFGRCFITQSFPTRPVQISVASATINVTAGANNMSLDDFNIVTNAGGAATTITSLFVSVPIGATLHVGSGQTAGSYSGSFTLNVNLQ